MKSELKRVGCKFQEELNDIRQKRMDEKVDDRKATNPELTNMIPRHKNWKEIKEDLINHIFKRNKKGSTTIGLISLMVVAFISLVVIGIIVFIWSTISTNLAIDVAVGQVNLANITAVTLTPLSNALLDNADLIAYSFLFGLIISMFTNAYFLRDTFHRLFIILDIIILVVVYIIAVYISYIYELLINATADFSVYVDYLPKASTLMLNLPVVISIVGVIVMIISYSKLPRSEDEPILNTDDVMIT